MKAYASPDTAQFADAVAAQIFGEGWHAHEAGRSVETNPWPEESISASSEWDDGWYAAAAAKATRYGG